MNDTVNGVVRQTTEVSTVNLRRYSCRPGGGPPSHIQTREKEAFYILEGQLTFYGHGAEIAAGSGTYCDIQKGTQHRFRNNTERTAKMLLFSAPAGIEGLFDEFSRLNEPDGEPEALATLNVIGEKYGVQYIAD